MRQQVVQDWRHEPTNMSTWVSQGGDTKMKKLWENTAIALPCPRKCQAHFLLDWGSYRGFGHTNATNFHDMWSRTQWGQSRDQRPRQGLRIIQPIPTRNQDYFLNIIQRRGLDWVWVLVVLSSMLHFPSGVWFEGCDHVWHEFGTAIDCLQTVFIFTDKVWKDESGHETDCQERYGHENTGKFEVCAAWIQWVQCACEGIRLSLLLFSIQKRACVRMVASLFEIGGFSWYNLCCICWCIKYDLFYTLLSCSFGRTSVVTMCMQRHNS